MSVGLGLRVYPPSNETVYSCLITEILSLIAEPDRVSSFVGLSGDYDILTSSCWGWIFVGLQALWRYDQNLDSVLQIRKTSPRNRLAFVM